VHTTIPAVDACFCPIALGRTSGENDAIVMGERKKPTRHGRTTSLHDRPLWSQPLEAAWLSNLWIGLTPSKRYPISIRDMLSESDRKSWHLLATVRNKAIKLPPALTRRQFIYIANIVTLRFLKIWFACRIPLRISTREFAAFSCC
jgi:hypothetical protein